MSTLHLSKFASMSVDGKSSTHVSFSNQTASEDDEVINEERCTTTSLLATPLDGGPDAWMTVAGA